MSSRARVFPDTLAVAPLERPPVASIELPGSKSITNRALVLAALSDPIEGSELRGALECEDTEAMVDALRQLGFRVQADWPASRLHVRRGPSPSPIPAGEADLFVANSGTSMRFLTAMVSLGHGRYRLDGVSRMRERPIRDLLHALRQLGVKARSERDDDFPPVVVEAAGLGGGNVRLRGDVSSQFLTGLLMAGPLARAPITVAVEGALVSAPYVAMTVRMMEQFGVSVQTDLASYFHIPLTLCYRPRVYSIEPDATAASYFFALAALTGGQICVPGLRLDGLQGDIRFVNVLEEMGCRVDAAGGRITVLGGLLRGVDVDMNGMSDCVMTLAALACFAEGPTTIRNVAHIRHKETDRLGALVTELRRVGANVEERPDGLKITPAPLHGAAIETYNDHRIAMSMALLGLKVPGILIRNPACVTKTYPGFFDDLAKLCG